MFERRMRSLGKTGGESIRNHSQRIMDASWLRDPATKLVYVKWVNSGLPSIDDEDVPVYAKFNVKGYHNITGDEIAYLLQFRLEDMRENPNIKVGSYVSIENEMGEREWWLIWHLDDRTQFRQFSILKCTWIYRWTTFKDGESRIYSCYGVTRNQKNYNSGVWLDFTFQVVEQQHVMFLPANCDTNTIQYDTKFLISNVGRYPPIAWKISKIQPSVSFDIVTFTMTQEQFDPTHDNAELMIANYYQTSITPDESQCEDIRTLRITYSGKPLVSAGGGSKKFTLQEQVKDEWQTVDQEAVWNVDFGDNSDKISLSPEIGFCKVKCKDDYNLIGQTFTLTATIGKYDATIEVEVASL